VKKNPTIAHFIKFFDASHALKSAMSVEAKNVGPWSKITPFFEGQSLSPKSRLF
jgi:hypothetical protein